MPPEEVGLMHIILFDIDGTLVKKTSTEADERERFRRAVCDEVGRSPPIEPWQYDGMVDPQICRLLLIDVGLSDSAADEHLQRVIERVGQIYLAMEKRPVLNEGVGKLLKILSASSRHKLGVITGNLSLVAEEKLRLTGTLAYFAETFYSDGYFERTELAKAAVRTCVGKYRLRGEKSVTIVGDTPRDVEAAKFNGAKAVAVASGFFSEGELTAAGADAVFHDLNPRGDLLRVLEIA
jgi:phosphoglycolate phosphatase-like HAD superfamily hydrolase